MAAENEMQERFFSRAGEVMGKLADAVLADGKLADAGARGFDELGKATVAFPDSIQSQMPGTLWNNADGSDRIPSPSEIVDAVANEPEQEAVRDLGREMGR